MVRNCAPENPSNRSDGRWMDSGFALGAPRNDGGANPLDATLARLAGLAPLRLSPLGGPFRACDRGPARASRAITLS